MSKPNFDKLIDRRNTNSYKWDEYSDVLPMWVADMDFETAPCITEALRRRVEHGIFGYTFVPDSYYEAIINWFQRRHHWTIQQDWIQYTTGVVPALSCVIKALTMPGEKVIVMTPVYNCFFSSIRNNGCEVLTCPLLPTQEEPFLSDPSLPTTYSYEIDFEAFEDCCEDEKATLFVLCNPHNPAGRVWRTDELEKIATICRQNHVRVVSDEIHCEIVMPCHHYVPYATIDDTAIVLCSPSKSFNTAGLQIANIICRDAETRRRIDRAININEVCDVNPFGVIALEAAYNEGEEWLTALNEYIYCNYRAFVDYFNEWFPQLPVTTLEGTYLVWVDISATEMTGDELTDCLKDHAELLLSSGSIYGDDRYVRFNIACPRSRMMEGLRRFRSVVKSLL